MGDVEKVSGDAVSRDDILSLENLIRNLPQLDIDKLTTHHFAPGVYVRQVLIPAGSVATGKIHRRALMNIMVQGRVRVNTPEGMQDLLAPHIFTQEPGCKRAFYAYEDTIWLNVLPTDLTDLDEIEKEFIAPSFDALAHDERGVE